MKIGLRMEDEPYLSKRSVGIKKTAVGLMRIWSPSIIGDTTRF